MAPMSSENTEDAAENTGELANLCAGISRLIIHYNVPIESTYIMYIGTRE